MSVRFAGSGGRRRRNLATYSEPELVTRSNSRRSLKKEKPESAIVVNSVAAHFPVKKLISQKKWKLWLISFCLISTCGLFLYARRQMEIDSSAFSPDMVKLFSIDNGLLYRSVNSVLVFLSAQLALGIWWARSRSLQDFSGQYRTWFTVTVIGFFISFCMATDAHLVFSNSVSWYWKIDFWKKELLGWVVPLLGCATAVVCSMHIELRKNQLSLSLFWLSMLIWGCRLSLSFDVGQEYFAEEMPLVKTASLNAGSIFLFMSLLFHTRFVVHVDSGPPVAQVSLRKKIFGRLRFKNKENDLQKKTETEPKKKTTPRKATKTATKTVKPLSAEKKTIKKEPAKKAAVASKVKPAPKKVAPSKPIIAKETDSATVSSKSSHAQSRKQKNGSTESHAAFSIQDYYFEPGEPLDNELLKGLSKKERRQLRKTWKESQRAA